MSYDDVVTLIGTTIAAHFQRSGEWPAVRGLQRHFKSHGSIERIAAEAPDLIICEQSSSSDAVCKLTARGFAAFAPSAPEIELYLATARYAARRSLEDEQINHISSAELGAALAIDSQTLHKVGTLIREWGGFWQSASGLSASADFSFTPSKDAWYFEDVRSLEEFYAAQKRATEDQLYASERRNSGLTAASVIPRYPVRKSAPIYTHAAPAFSVTIDRFNIVANDSLRSMLLIDANELNRAFEHGSWKSVGFLAGSCCEGVLIDVLEREEPRTSDRLGPDWRHSRGLSHLISAAHSFGILNELTADLAKFLKRWRDLIHPWRATKHPAPTREVALSIVALLEWLLAELNSTGSSAAL